MANRNPKMPKGWTIAGMVDVASTSKAVQALWERFEANFPKQEGNEPARKNKSAAIWYTTNGKSRRTKVIRLFEKLSIELGSLAGDVREAKRDQAPKLPKVPTRSTMKRR